MDEIRVACRKLRVETRDLFLLAAGWVNKRFGQRIKRGEALAAFRRWLNTNRRYKPNWLTKFMQQGVPA